ncbi:MAG TPA: glycoside hydrolase family 57 protein [Candidatus Deferrimicrobiaceae bacterium]|nr:glycoside hydrolase family 57 protein [Candidatus Deferrimicrobiaceae bacterium]
MKLYLCFLWHMHQPYYKDPETGTYILPWVRLHAIKDYVALPRIFREFPGVRHTFNLVPSLLIQVQDYVENGAEDVFLTLSRKNSLDLTKKEEEFLLRNFFSAHPPTMILPQPRYAELYRRREAGIRAVEKSGAPGGFGSSDYTDLMTLFNLAWFHPLHRVEDEELARLWRKGSGYTEREKGYVLDRQIDLMATVLTEYRRVAEQDGGELTSSPMFHPILPLLIDSRAAQDALPGAPLPRILFSHPDDAMEQVFRGREVFRSFFGKAPEGMWPSEGSISPAAIEIAARAGFRWMATDEILLSKVLGKYVHRDASGAPQDPSWLYHPYIASTPSGPLRIFFRDHYLSDLIGFEYSRWSAPDAASHFISIINNIYNKLSFLPAPQRKDSYVVPVILDGENAWEYFPDSGEGFLRTFLGQLSRLGPNITCATFSDALKTIDYEEHLDMVPSGSWIDGTFNIWIGHREDHAAWELLARARNLWQLRSDQARTAGLTPSKNLIAAYDHLLAAEGSDWCWWYGDEHFTPHAPEFDRLFRSHVKAAYRELGEVPPDSIDIPIVRMDRIPAERNLLATPRTFIRPKINGKLTSYYEWSAATRYIPRPEFGAMHRAVSGVLECLYYGFDERNLYLRLDLHGSIFESPESFEAEIFFPKKNRKISMVLFPAKPSVSAAIGNIGEILISNHLPDDLPEAIRAAFHKVLELGIPFRELDCAEEERIEFFLTIVKPGAVGERWPLYGTFIAELPGKGFEERMWEV